ncbi:MAG: 16S rRNA (guanine(966)-N(2))-methyltransferase RsmD [Thermodesulfovibrionales bacterium]
MKISGGTVKGRRTATKRLLIKNSEGERLRPTSSKVREALFDILRNKIEGASFVDLYAGTGTVGLEALSRGAGRSAFVEPDELRIRTIKNNVLEIGFLEQALVIKGRAYEFLQKASAENESYDIFFIDPPYDSEEIEKILPLLGEAGLVNEDGVVIVEHFFKRHVPEKAGRLKMKRSYRYGDTMLTLYRKVEI